MLLSTSAGGDNPNGPVLPLFEAEYQALRRMAGELMRAERGNHTLQPTALVHEAFARLAGSSSAMPTERDHFFALASRVMRRVLVDHARRHGAERRGGGALRVSLEQGMVGAMDGGLGLVEIDELLERLAAEHGRAAVVAELKLFSGLTGVEIAGLLGVSARTVDLDWRLARAWIADRVGAEGG